METSRNKEELWRRSFSESCVQMRRGSDSPSVPKTTHPLLIQEGPIWCLSLVGWCFPFLLLLLCGLLFLLHPVVRHRAGCVMSWGYYWSVYRKCYSCQWIIFFKKIVYLIRPKRWNFTPDQGLLFWNGTAGSGDTSSFSCSQDPSLCVNSWKRVAASANIWVWATLDPFHGWIVCAEVIIWARTSENGASIHGSVFSNIPIMGPVGGTRCSISTIYFWDELIKSNALIWNLQKIQLLSFIA